MLFIYLLLFLFTTTTFEHGFGSASSSFEPVDAGLLTDCQHAEFGCCNDGLTAASGPGGLGCSEHERFIRDTSLDSNQRFKRDGEEDGSGEADELHETPIVKVEEIGSGEGSADGSTEIKGDQGCAGSPHGCCPDGSTAAQGPDGEGCNAGCSSDDGCPSLPTAECSESEFGCCSDNTTAASGPNHEGCPGCETTEFGCCPNKKTVASGPQNQGCTCHDYPYGCCTDNYTPATGPDHQGCECSRMLYGCCHDGQTAATGANYEGCPQTCRVSESGCCHDNFTSRRGPSEDDCPCQATRFGCCPDGVTVAKDANLRGCPCQTLQYGCCPDGITPATGPRYQGCVCQASKYGCCPDGVTVAFGPNFEGCPTGPSLEIEKATEVCSLPKERGPCLKYEIKWYFDPKYGGCLRFWYGGCEGNGNRFDSKIDCERSCVAPDGPDVCNLPKIGGPCEGNYTAFFFNNEKNKCEIFQYGGCLGNKNRFDNQQECEALCIYGQPDRSKCEQPADRGPCRGFYSRWHYDSTERRCKQFVYGGCQGNQNNFQTEDECRHSCGQLSPEEICVQPKAEGPCLGKFPRYYYDVRHGKCEEFTYSGCRGNRNRFVDRETCEQTCNQTRIKVTDVCSQPSDPGPCQTHVIRWYHNADQQRCLQFYYGGCEGNSNRFDSREMCERTCLAREPSPSLSTCNLPVEPGNGVEYRERFYYDPLYKRCSRFYFSGVGGNANNFETLIDCQRQCAPQELVTTTQASVGDFKVEYCLKEVDRGDCDSYELKYYYDGKDGVCKQFYWSGCHGNENRFASSKECEMKCWNSQNICRLPKISGPCSGKFIQWYFDATVNLCLEFHYGGCEGNANRFNSKDACETQCLGVSQPGPAVVTLPSSSGQDPCQLRPDFGNGQQYIPVFYYSSRDNQCKQFVYSGAGGNDNRFNRLEECERRCLRSLPLPVPEPGPEDNKEIVCRLEVDSGGTCEFPDTQARYFYDPASGQCIPFVFNNCPGIFRGNKNSFKTYDYCMRFCFGVRASALPPPMPIPQNIDCPDDECEEKEQRCPYGIDQVIDEKGCKSCRCTNPCHLYQCPEGMQCTIEGYRTADGQVKAQPVCRQINKPGTCPSSLPPVRDTAIECVDRCRNDADCRDHDKCCHNGCAHTCIRPDGIPDQPAHVPQPPEIIPEQPRPDLLPPAPIGDLIDSYLPPLDVTASTESTVTIDCTREPNYIYMPEWTFNGQRLYISETRIQLLANGSLLIRNLDTTDAGVYHCNVQLPRGGRHQGSTRLIVYRPVAAKIHIVSPQFKLGTSLTLECRVTGYPPPQISWSFNEQPYSDSNEHHVLINGGHQLTIRQLTDADSGDYRCFARNQYSEAADTLMIKVEDVFVPHDCLDSPIFANCPLIVSGRYCSNVHYAKFCCRSCFLAGQRAPSLISRRSLRKLHRRRHAKHKNDHHNSVLS